VWAECPDLTPITWTPAMDRVVRDPTIRAAVAPLGVSQWHVVTRRVELAAMGQHVKARGSQPGRPKGAVARDGPRPGVLEVIRLHGLGFAQFGLAKRPRIPRQAVHDVVQNYVLGEGPARRWCPECLTPHRPALDACPACGTARGAP
jgi:hypothetical protein